METSSKMKVAQITLIILVTITLGVILSCISQSEGIIGGITSVLVALILNVLSELLLQLRKQKND